VEQTATYATVMDTQVVGAEPAAQMPMAQMAQTQPNYMSSVPAELQRDVMAKRNQIVFGDASTIQNFGAEIVEASAQFTNGSTNIIKLGNAGEIGNKLNEMMRVSKKLDPSKILSNKEAGFFGRIFGKAKDAIVEFKNDQSSINQALTTIGNNLLTDKKRLEEENKKIEAMFVQNAKNIKMFDVILAAGMIAKSECEQQAEQIRQKAQASGTPEDANEYRSAQSFMRQLDVRLANINSARSIAILQAPALKDMQEGNAMQIENIQSMVMIGIPAWHQQIQMYVSQLETRKSVETTTALAQNINETMKATARLQGENSVMIAEAANRPIIEVETIQTIQNELISSMEKVNQINETGKQKRAETTQKLLQLETELKQKMLAR
jgi:uncharacterized protein YaaN involved in tellurite resistance